MLSALEQFDRNTGESALAEHQRQGSQVFRELGLPTVKQENWKYTNVKVLNDAIFNLADPNTTDLQLNPAHAIEELAQNRLVFVDNVFQPALSSTAELGQGVTLTSRVIDQSLQELGSVVDIKKHNFAALNQAFLQEFTWLNLDKNTQLDTPVYLLFVSKSGAVMAHPRVLITAGTNSKATVVEHYIGESNGHRHHGLTNAITEIKLDPGAQVEHYKLQEQGETSYHFSGLHAHLNRDSRLVSHNIDLGGALVRNDIVTNLDGPGASVVLNGYYMAGSGQHVDNHTCINHLKPNTQSLEDYRGVIDEGGRCVFNGKVLVSPNAQKIEAHQSNNNLLLSEKAEIDTKPELEIYADDVKCSHGATIGQLDKDALFYLRSRGISTTMATALLTFAFAESVISRLGLETVRERMQAAVATRLPDYERIKEFL